MGDPFGQANMKYYNVFHILILFYFIDGRQVNPEICVDRAGDVQDSQNPQSLCLHRDHIAIFVFFGFRGADIIFLVLSIIAICKRKEVNISLKFSCEWT